MLAEAVFAVSALRRRPRWSGTRGLRPMDTIAAGVDIASCFIATRHARICHCGHHGDVGFDCFRRRGGCGREKCQTGTDEN